MRPAPRILLILLMLDVAGASAGAASDLREEVGRYFEEWYPYIQGGTVAVSAIPEIAQPGFEARAPEVEAAVARRGGFVEARFLPLVKNHPWAFAAAESASALAALDAGLYAKYRDAVFARAGSLTEAGCRDLASDVAESAGVAARYRDEIQSGRARGRVLADIRLAMRLGISTTPTFVHEGTLVSGESGLLESYLFERSSAPAAGH